MATLSTLQSAVSSLWSRRRVLIGEVDAVAYLATSVHSATEGPFADLLSANISGWAESLRASKAELYWVIRDLEREMEELV